MKKEEFKRLSKLPISQLTDEQIKSLFAVYSFQLKEYARSQQNLYFEIHFQRTYIIAVHYPLGVGLMSFNNDFIDFGNETYGISMARSEHFLDLLLTLIAYFQKNLLTEAEYAIEYREEYSPCTSEDEHIKLWAYAQQLLIEYKKEL